MSDAEPKLLEFIAEETGMSSGEFGATTPLFSEGYIDSFTMTAIIAFVEDEFGISVSQSDITLENFDSVANMVAFIARQRV